MKKTRTAIIGCGGMAQYHLKNILKQQDTTQIVALCDPNPAALSMTTEKMIQAKWPTPPTFIALDTMLAQLGPEIEAVYIITPHAMHHDQAVACLEAGIDVLLEKPMAMNTSEAISLIDTRDRTGRLLVIGFQGSLSPEIRTAVKLLRSGELGEILNINGMVWQAWKEITQGTWRQQPELSGGGFMFDTGAHLLNTISDLAGEPFVEVSAWFNSRGAPVDILAAAIGRLESGAFVTFNACGDTIDICSSDIRVFCRDGILQTGMWGGYLNLQRRGELELKPVECPLSLGPWQQFLAVRRGEMANPSPPEIGLRMIRLWDALRASAQQGGRPVACL
ncbi:MAG TPA: Gfo/Idh/MocA family oxidoreductase [Anaerolineae bacterium]|nr:Gfo/Idh/MocA family oxidoreductase [Anaerolineae bacterium]HMR64533.1 Gfo/Idh/MocA family oxidoreductase [Anaerolineae bacterium]